MAQGFPNKNFIQAYSFLAPEQKLEDTELTPSVDSYAFGILSYYLLFRKIPEGCFDLPSKGCADAVKNWDFLINRCLQPNPNVRPQNLIQAMEKYLNAPRALSNEVNHLSEVEPKVENVQQMAFALEKESEAEPESESSLKPVLKAQEIARPEYEPDPGAIFQKELQVTHYTPNKVETKEIEPILTEMVVIPGGTYLRGSGDGARDEMPRHSVMLDSFAIDVHPVTNEQFVRFLESMGGEKDHNNNDIIRLRDSRVKRSGGKLIIESGYVKHPVVGVTWYGCCSVC